MARILIVEDEPLIAMMLAEWLVELGHEALGPAETVGDALRLIEETAPSAAILDINLQDQRCERGLFRSPLQPVPTLTRFPPVMAERRRSRSHTILKPCVR
jgi:CheY-like chemotaxis protein